MNTNGKFSPRHVCMQLWSCFCARRQCDIQVVHTNPHTRCSNPCSSPLTAALRGSPASPPRVSLLLVQSCDRHVPRALCSPPPAGNSICPFLAARGISEPSWGKPGVSSALQLPSAHHQQLLPWPCFQRRKDAVPHLCVALLPRGWQKQAGFSQPSQINRIKILTYSSSA